MNIQFSKCCACIVALSICFPATYAFTENGFVVGSSSLDDLSQTVRAAFGKTEEIWEVKKEPLDKGEQRTYLTEENENCTDRSIHDFPADLFTDEQRRQGAVVLHAFFGFYCFVLTAFICHDYLLPSVELICTNMNISTDVAGATFLAMASSFPEMFVNVVGTFLTESDLGAGTVVGSAVFDTFATPACGALTALCAISLEWRVLTRDCTMYVISVGTLVLIMWDQRIVWYEAVSLLVLFFAYLVLLFAGKSILGCYRETSCSSSKKKRFDIDGNNSTPNESYKSQNDSVVNHPEKRKDGGNEAENGGEGSLEKLAEPSEAASPFVWPEERSLTKKCWFLFCWPLKFLLFATIPDCRTERLMKWYPLTFVMCVIWIGLSSYFVSWMMTVVGDTAGIPDSIMGITFLAAGGNIPEMASIVILARQGDGNMAMSNTLGANILDILLCLGLPWTIKCLMSGKDVEIVSGALSYSVLSIVICIIALYAVIAFFGFKLNKKVGLICLLLYTIFLVFAILVEMNVFYLVNLPMCD
ncbi:sodium/potassium/calcium exchanger 4 isoform X1 [Osmia lignaria lignaria]|uniref:sodium/potassium/calcium exchanger 4 isoform X1 n=1 Tax=Osmia lignaria lignaria TaxID=1437193 RepID=UPI001478ED9C|nr:sodium/potassium/calcium exchanger 4-like isoform X1 [Osmia lignaria]